GKKKKKKKDAGPLVEQKWFKALTIVLALFGMAAVAYWMLKPPSAVKLYAAIDEAKSPEAKLAAAKEYLRRYGAKPAQLTDKAAAAFRDGKGREREGQLNKRLGFPKLKDDPGDDDPQAYAAAMKAIQAEKDGQLTTAEALWTQVKARFPEEAKLPFTFDDDKLKKAVWGSIGANRLRHLAHPH